MTHSVRSCGAPLLLALLTLTPAANAQTGDTGLLGTEVSIDFGKISEAVAAYDESLLPLEQAIDESAIPAAQRRLVELSEVREPEAAHVLSAVRDLGTAYRAFLGQISFIQLSLDAAQELVANGRAEVTTKQAVAMSSRSGDHKTQLDRSTEVLSRLARAIRRAEEVGEDVADLRREFNLVYQRVLLLESLVVPAADALAVSDVYGQIRELLTRYLTDLEETEMSLSLAQTVLTAELDLLDMTEVTLKAVIARDELARGLADRGIGPGADPARLKAWLEDLVTSRSALGRALDNLGAGSFATRPDLAGPELEAAIDDYASRE